MKRLASIAWLGLTAGVLAEAADKSQFSLLNPVPRPLMRPMETDRPDTTESAYTVDAGHFQIESTLFGFGKDGGVESYTFAEANFKIGLTNRADFQIVVPFFERESGGESDAGFGSAQQIAPFVEHPGGRDDSGIGDLTARLKFNLWGNDGGATSLAVMPFVKVPTASHDLGNDKVEGGIIFPLAVDLGSRAGLGLMAEFDVVHDDERASYQMAFVDSIVLGIDWTERVGSYVEFVSVARTGSASWEGYASTGLTVAISDDLALDGGLVFGVNDAADDFGVFAGFSFRL